MSAKSDLPRRFYQAAASGPVGGGFGVLLDERPARTPQGKRLVVPTPAVAALMAKEWAAQGEQIRFARMPATRLAFTAVDRVAGLREETAAEVARYAGSELLCYFAEGPEALVGRQTVHWGGMLDWAEAELGLVLVRTQGVIHRDQPEPTLARARQLAAELDAFQLAGLAHGAGLLSSAVLAFALHRGRLKGVEAFDLSRLDEAFQEELWGVDPEAAARAKAMRAEAVMLEHWFAALR